jgi:hypothetical protein
VVDITNRAKGLWNSISSTCQERIICKKKKRLQHLCTIDEFSVPAFVCPDEMGDGVDDIDTMFD